MNLVTAYILIRRYNPDAVLHRDHICSDRGAHDSNHCPLDESEQYTQRDAERDTAAALRERLRSI